MHDMNAVERREYPELFAEWDARVKQPSRGRGWLRPRVFHADQCEVFRPVEQVPFTGRERDFLRRDRYLREWRERGCPEQDLRSFAAVALARTYAAWKRAGMPSELLEGGEEQGVHVGWDNHLYSLGAGWWEWFQVLGLPFRLAPFGEYRLARDLYAEVAPVERAPSVAPRKIGRPSVAESERITREVRRMLRLQPRASLRHVATATGVSPNTVRKVKVSV